MFVPPSVIQQLMLDVETASHLAIKPSGPTKGSVLMSLLITPIWLHSDTWMLLPSAADARSGLLQKGFTARWLYIKQFTNRYTKVSMLSVLP